MQRKRDGGIVASFDHVFEAEEASLTSALMCLYWLCKEALTSALMCLYWLCKEELSHTTEYSSLGFSELVR